ncbi:MAG: MerR family transcriptional regulator [Anaerolineales bacterium]
MLSKTPAFNLKAVLKETGLAADTLRAWERRYGLPKPQRTPGGHRLYSQYDIETIKWLMARQAEGLSISRAVDLWNEHIASGLDPLANAAVQAASPLTAAPADTSLDALRAGWLTACLHFDESRAEQTLNQAFAMFSVEAVCINILQRALAEIGELWYHNRASVQQEHFASALAMRRLDALLSAAPAPTRKETIIVGCPAGEWHAFTALLLSLFLRRRGWNVVYLGANVPNDRLAETAQTVRADLVILVAQILVTAASLQLAAQTLAAQNVRVAYGGRIFNLHPSLREKIPAHFLGETIEASVLEAEQLLRSKPPIASKTFRISDEHLAAHQFFTAKRAEIELTLKQLMPSLSISPGELESGIQHLGDNIAAALQLGDMSYVSGEMDWLKTLLQSHNRPRSELIHFMQRYAEAVNRHINGSGKPIVEWLNAFQETI